jgi:integrase
LLLFLRLGLRTEEVAALMPGDIDWKNGTVTIRSAKTYRKRTLHLPQDVGEGLIAYLRGLHTRPRCMTGSFPLVALNCASDKHSLTHDQRIGAGHSILTDSNN